MKKNFSLKYILVLNKTLPYSKGNIWSLEIEDKVVVGGGLCGLSCAVAGGGHRLQSRFDSFFPVTFRIEKKNKRWLSVAKFQGDLS